MTNNTDAQIAREWAEKISIREKITFSVDDETLAAARHILAATTPPTMADLGWDNEAHAGLCAESTDDGVVRMIGPDWVNDHADHIMCYLGDGQFDGLPMRSLTPLPPGTRLDLTPRREPESTPEPVPESVLTTEEDVKPDPQPGEAWLIEFEGKRYEAIYWYSALYAHWVFVEDREGTVSIESHEAAPVSRLVGEAVLSHPTVLTTEADYENAPEGTIITYGDIVAVKIEDGTWKWVGLKQAYNPYDLAAGSGDFAPCTVVRWGK